MHGGKVKIQQGLDRLQTGGCSDTMFATQAFCLLFLHQTPKLDDLCQKHRLQQYATNSLLRVYSQLATSHCRDNVIRIVARSKMTEVATVVMQEWQRPRSGGTGRLQPLRRGKNGFESSFIHSFVRRLRRAFVKCSMNLCRRYEHNKNSVTLIKRGTAVKHTCNDT